MDCLLCSNQRMLAEFEQHLTESQQRCAAAKESEARVTKLLVDIKTGVDHLAEKLDKLKAVRSSLLCISKTHSN